MSTDTACSNTKPSETPDFEKLDWPFHKRVGFAAILLGQMYDDRLFSRLRNFAAAEMHGCSKFFFDEHGNLLGGACWARIDSTRIEQYLANEFLLRDTEWCEGSFVVITDIVSPFSDRAEIYQRLLAHLRASGIEKLYRYTGTRIARVPVHTISPSDAD